MSSAKPRGEETGKRDYREIAPTLRTGDIYLAAGIRKISLIIRVVSGLFAGRGKDPWSHVGVVVIPAQLGITSVANPEEPHLWESTIDLDVADAMRNDTQPGPMLVPLIDRLRGATAGEEPHYEAFAIRRFRYEDQPFADTLDPEKTRRFTEWIERVSDSGFSKLNMAADWLRSEHWKLDLSNSRALAAGDLFACARRIGHSGLSRSITTVIGMILFLPLWLMRIVIRPLATWALERLSRKALTDSWRTFKERKDYPCSILAANSFDVLGALDTTRRVIPAFTPTDFAGENQVPLRAGFRFGVVEKFTFERSDRGPGVAAPAAVSPTAVSPRSAPPHRASHVD